MKEKKTKNFDILDLSDMKAVRAGNGVTGDVNVSNTAPAPMVKDSSIT